MLSQVQANVLRILNIHHDHGQQLNLLKQVVEGLEKDIGIFKTSLEDLESRQKKLEATDAAQAMSKSSAFDVKAMLHSMEKSISNVTQILDTQGDHCQQLEKKHRRLRRMMSGVTTTVEKMEKSVIDFRDESHTLGPLSQDAKRDKQQHYTQDSIPGEERGADEATTESTRHHTGTR